MEIYILQVCIWQEGGRKMTKVFIHGSGHKGSSWNEVVKNMHNNKDILCPDLSTILSGKEASYSLLYSSFVEYCNGIEGKIDLCGLSLGGILALNYAIEYPGKVKSLVLIGTPHLGNTMQELDFSNNVQVINCPTLIICGGKDKANMKSAHFLSENIKGSELRIIKETGHVVNEENPKELARILDDYYDGN